MHAKPKYLCLCPPRRSSAIPPRIRPSIASQLLDETFFKQNLLLLKPNLCINTGSHVARGPLLRLTACSSSLGKPCSSSLYTELPYGYQGSLMTTRTVRMPEMDLVQRPARLPHDYYYESLPNPRTYIRLLRIERCNSNATIHCTLTQWLLEESPPYCAISYTWGDPMLRTNIVTNLKTMTIRKNCEDALRQTYAAEPQAYLWVDAICINQDDNVEKSQQVAVMAGYYRRAVRVLVCVGQHDSNSRFVFGVLRWYNGHFTRMYEHITALYNKGSVKEWTHQTWGLDEHLSGRKSIMLLGRRTQLDEAVHYFFERPYFSRVWVLQELYMGNGRVTICCGTDQQSLGPLFALARWISNCGISHLDRYVGVFYRGYIPLTDKKHQFGKTYGKRFPLMALGAGSNIRPSRLRHVVETLRNFECENPKDRIYGVLALVDWEGRRTIPTPDYNKDLLELAKEVLDMILEGSPDDHGLWFHESFLDVISKFRRMFNIPPQDEALRKSVEARNGPMNNRTTLQERRELPRFADIRWRGTRLSLISHEAQIRDTVAGARSPGAIYLGSKQSNEKLHKELVNCDGIAIAWAPKATREDDWFLECDRSWISLSDYSCGVSDWRKGLQYSFYVGKALVVRPDGEGGYYIVGPALPNRGSSQYLVRLPDAQCFKIWWQLEDALVLEGLFSKYDKCKECIAELGDWSYMSAWVFPGSTIIKGPFEPEEIARQLMAKNYDGFKEPGWLRQDSQSLSWPHRDHWAVSGDSLV